MSVASYEDHQKREDARYVTTYGDWVRSLSPKQRANLRERGIDIPDLARTGFPGREPDEPSGDAAESSRASYLPDLPESIDGLAGKLVDSIGLAPAQARKVVAWHRTEIEEEAIRYRAFLFQRVCAEFLRPGNVRLRAIALGFAANLAALNGLGTQHAAARSIHVTRSALSKVVKQWQRLLDLRPSPHMKSAAACSVYSKTQKQNHWRNRKCQPPQKTS